MNTIRIMTATALAVLGLTVTTKAQVRINIVRGNEAMKTEPIDKAAFSAEYRMTFVEDTSKRDKPNEEIMMLTVGNKSSVWYSYSKHLQDSVLTAGLAAGASMEAIGEQMRNYASGVSYKIYKGYPTTDKATTLDRIAADLFRCEEENDTPAWELRQDTATILSYLCRKAVCLFKGRKYEAWYAPDIPKSDGPWKLHGLPGLILKASDGRKEYDFECIAIVNARDGQEIRYGATGYEPITRKNLNRQYERYALDPVGYVTSANPNAKIVIRNEAGESIKPMNTPYNPIELSEQ